MKTRQYDEEIKWERIEEGLKDMVGKNGGELKLYLLPPREVPKEWRNETFGSTSFLGSITLYSPVPNPLAGYESEEIKELMKAYPNEWEEIRPLILEVLRQPYSCANRELYLRLEGLEEKTRELRLRREKRLYLATIRRIKRFLRLPVRIKAEKIAGYFRCKAHEVGHLIFPFFLGSPLLACCCQEGLAEAFAFCYLSAQVEEENLPFGIFRLAALNRKKFYEEQAEIVRSSLDYNMLLKKDLPPLELFSCSHVIGYGILCVDDAWKEALNIHFERLSSEEIKERMKEIVEKVEKRKDEIIRMRDLRAIKELEERLEEEIRRLFS